MGRQPEDDSVADRGVACLRAEVSRADGRANLRLVLGEPARGTPLTFTVFASPAVGTVAMRAAREMSEP